MVKNRSQANAGGERGLTIVLEGSSAAFIKDIAARLEAHLTELGYKVRGENSFANREERVLFSTLRLLDSSGMPLAASSLSLVVATMQHRRLKLMQSAKSAGAYCVATLSWLSEAHYYEAAGYSEFAKQIIADCGFMRPDVWVVFDEPRGSYARIAKQAGVRVYSPKIATKKLLTALMEHVDYAEKAKIIPPETQTEQMAERTATTAEQAEQPGALPQAAKGRTLSELAVSSLALKSDSSTFSEQAFLYEKDAKSNNYRYYRPKSIGPKVLKAYETILDKIFANYSQIVASLGGDDKARRLAAGLLPLATLKKVTYTLPPDTKIPDRSLLELSTKAAAHAGAQKKLHEIINTVLPSSLDANADKGANLISWLPRNEMDIAPHFIYELAANDAASLASNIGQLPHETKHSIFSAFLEDSGDRQPLRHALYSWDAVADYKTFRRLVKILPLSSIVKQSFSPRYGYTIPKAIEDAGLSEAYEQAFDLSLELYSLLQAAGYETEAQYAVLAGHRLRFKISLNAYEFMDVMSSKNQRSYDVNHVLEEMYEQVASAHPLIAGLIRKPSDEV